MALKGRHVAVVAVVFASAGVALALLLAGDRPRPPAPAPPPVAVPVAPPLPARAPRRLPAPGESFLEDDDLVYQLEAENEVTIEGAGGPGGEKATVSFLGRGELTVEHVEPRGKGSIAALALRDAKLEARVNGQPAPAIPKEVLQGLGREALALRDEQGLIRGLVFAADVPGEARGLLRSWLADAQVAIPLDAATRTSWEAHEESPTGRTLTTYVVERRQAPQATVTRRRQYLSVFARGLKPGETPPALDVPDCEGDARVELDVLRRRIVSIDGRETLRFGQDPKTALPVQFTGRSRIQLRLLRATRAPADVRAVRRARLESVRRYVEAGATSPFLPEPGEAPPTVRVGDDAQDPRAAFDLALRDLELALGKPEGWASESPRAFQVFARVFRQDPGLVRRAVEDVRAARLPALALKTVIDALGEAGTPEAQDALLELVQDSKAARDMVLQAVLSLSAVREPKDAVVARLRALAGAEVAELATAATRSLGVLGHGVTKPELAQEIAMELEDRLPKAPAAQRPVVVEALGNTAHERSLAPLVAALEDPDAAVRAMAARALRSYRKPEAEAALAKAIAKDAVPDVRIAAIRAATTGQPGVALQQAIETTVKSDQDPGVRAEALRWLEDRFATDPKARELVKQVASGDADEGVRNLANEALSRP